MVKATKTKEVDNTQSKISSFFGNANSNGKLFTSKLRLPKRKDNVAINNAPTVFFKHSPEKSQKLQNFDKPNPPTLFTVIQNPSAQKISTHESEICGNNLTNASNKSFEDSDQYSMNKQREKSAILTSSLTSQPLTFKTNSTNSAPLVLSASPTFLKKGINNCVTVIPETPENKPRKPIGRAFLASSTDLKITVEHKINQVKNVHLLKTKNKIKCAKPGLVCRTKESTTNSTLSNNSVIDLTESNSLDGSSNVVESVTPIKKYINSNGSSTKRLAKNSISPSAKRNILTESCQFEKDVVISQVEHSEEDSNSDSENVGTELSDNEIEMWEDWCTKGANVWDDLGLSLLEKEKEDSNSVNKMADQQPANEKTESNLQTNQKEAEKMTKQKADPVNLLTNQDQILDESSHLKKEMTSLANNKMTSDFVLKQNKENKLNQSECQMSWSFKKTKKNKSKTNFVDDKNLLSEILDEIGSAPNSKPSTTNDSQSDIPRKMPLHHLSLPTSVHDVQSAPFKMTRTEDKYLLEEILCELKEGQNTKSEPSTEFGKTESKSEQSRHIADSSVKKMQNPEASDSSVHISILSADENQGSKILSVDTANRIQENDNAFSNSEFSKEVKINPDKNKLCAELDDIQDFSPWDSSFEIEEPIPDDDKLLVSPNLKRFDHSRLKKFSPFKPRVKCPKKTLPPVTPVSTNYNRFQVNEVKAGKDNIELTLNDGNQMKTCILYGFWCDSHVAPGDVVNVLGVNPDSAGVYHITDEEGLLVINPDTLVSGTTIVSTLFCMRKAILNERFKGIDKANVHMLYGNVIHCLFQEVLQKKLHKKEQLFDVAQKIIRRPNFLKEMYAQEMTESTIMEEITNYIPSILKWIDKHTTFSKRMPPENETLVTEIRDIEENIWSPRFGVKGKIDLTVEVKIKNQRKKIVPLELKTGRSSFSAEHKGQVTLYSMMSCDRQGDPGEGLLLYLKGQPIMETVPADQKNKRGLIQLRNELVDYLKKSLKSHRPLPTDLSVLLGNLPEPISNQRVCSKCPHLLNCSLYQRSMRKTPSPNGNWSNLLETTLAHLSTAHLDYFVRWCVMMEMENRSKKSGESLKGIWCSSGLDRELIGECLSNLQLTKSEKIPDSEKFLNTFQRHPLSKLKQEFAPLDSIGMCNNESVAVSAESKQQVVLCTGFLYSVNPENVVVISDRNLETEPDVSSIIFRVDKCDIYNTWGTCYYNLSILMSNNPHCARLRELIIDYQKPRIQTTLSKSLIQKVKTVFKPLNKPQRASVLKVLMSEDYVIVRGYPGTGKTSTIVALIKVLTNLGLSILLASYTHSAVDNILLKLKKEKVDFLRLGRKDRIHPEIYPFSEDFLIKSVTNVNELKEMYESKLKNLKDAMESKDLKLNLITTKVMSSDCSFGNFPKEESFSCSDCGNERVVATTCLGSNHVVFSAKNQMFDVCIVDEASQVTQLACIGPLFAAKKFILVGDSKQLPPVVQSKEAKNLGMDQSLFELLEKQGATVELHLQYRMNREIMALSNELMYNGCLRCGTTEISNQSIKPINIDLMKMFPSWMLDVISEDLEKSVVFLNTLKIPAPESYNSRGEVMNEIEAHLVTMIVQTLFLVGVPAVEIGIIAPYRNQVKHVQETLVSALEGHPVQEVEVNTVDQYQGRDKDVIIVTFVRSQSKNNLLSSHSGEILQDDRRLNVAVTRAKKKLILLGDVTTLQQFQPLSKILPFLKQKNQIRELPPGAHLIDLSKSFRPPLDV